LRLPDAGVEQMKFVPQFDPLRREPRFQAVERALKFETECSHAPPPRFPSVVHAASAGTKIVTLPAPLVDASTGLGTISVSMQTGDTQFFILR
jgi:hypothetical protein